MTEQRFMLTDNGYIYDKEDGAIHQTIETVVKQLNEFNDEIEEISNALDNMVTFKNKYRDKYKEMKEENGQLKQFRKDLLNLIEENIEIYEKTVSNIEFHQGEIQGKLGVFYRLRSMILNGLIGDEE